MFCILTRHRGFLIYSPDKIDEVIDLADELMTSIVPSTGGKLQVFLSFGSPPPAHTPAPVFVLFYNGPEGEARDICARLYALGPVADTTSVIPYPVMNTLLTSKMDTYKRHGLSAARLALPLDKDILKMAWESYASTIPRYKDTQPSHIGIELRDLRAGLRRSAADMAFAGRGNWTNILIHSQWDDPSMDYELRKWAKDLSKKVEDSTRPNEEEKEAAVYANYASGDEKSKDIFGGNLERLRELKAKYDPGMLFHKWYPIEPKKEYVDGA